jgi:magnesium transporter
MTTLKAEKLQESLRSVMELLERFRVLETYAQMQQGPKRELVEALAHRQNLTELQRKIWSLHPADLAYVLESLPLDDRLLVWQQAATPQASKALVEVSAAVRGALLEATERERTLEILSAMDADDLAYVAESLGEDLQREVYRSMGERKASEVKALVAHTEGTVGQLMSAEYAAVRESTTLDEALKELRLRGELPPQTDALFVVDARNIFRGSLPIQDLLVKDTSASAGELARADVVSFMPGDGAREAASAFERYDLVSAPVVDEWGKLIGRVTVDAVVDYIRAQAELTVLKRAGLAGEEDLFASPWASARNRAVWVGVNLVTAFVASRVIGVFEGTIRELVALAALMPIVASVGGNTGNQTMALMIRGLALGQIQTDSLRRVLYKEITVSLINGILWGAVMGLVAAILYHRVSLGLVMASAALLNLLVSAVVGVAVPLALWRSGRDPAQGASVLLTFTTDSMGFFIFLALAQAFLV